MYTQIIFSIAAFFIASTSSHPLYDATLSLGTQFNEKSSVAVDALAADSSFELPMIHNNNYDMIMPDFYDQNPAESMHYQNFETFYDPQMADNTELNMDESQFLSHTPVRAPQPLSADERRVRQRLEPVDLNRERKVMLKLKKGSTKRRPGAHQWEQFDYDSYSVDPSTYGRKSS